MAEKLKVIIEFDLENETVSTSIDSGVPHGLLLNELLLMQAGIVQSQLAARLQQAVQQRANGIEIATADQQVPPLPRRRF